MARKRRRRNLQSVFLACAAILGAHCLLYWALTSKRPPRRDPYLETAAGNHPDPPPVRPAAIRTPPRPVYPYSVIRGGAYSAAELDAALRADPVAAVHYAVFDRAHTRLTLAPDSAAVYVSYRQDNRIYWTRRKVRLARQEPLLTDGVHTARARCGNRISLTPQLPAPAAEPSAILLNLPEPPPPADAPLLVHEIFPAPLGNGLPDGLPDGVPGGSAGSPPFGADRAGPPGPPFPPPPDETPLPAESTSPPSPPTNRPSQIYPLPLPPELPPPDAPPPFPAGAPEPATAALLLCGAAILAARLRSRH